CILAYVYRCLNNYEQAHLYLNEAIRLKRKNPIVQYICGEIYFRQNNYSDAIRCLKYLTYKVKINNLHIILGNSYLFNKNYYEALENYNIALKNSKNSSNSYLCLKHCAYIYEKLENDWNTLKMLDKLLSINEKDSLILCYYGETLCNIGKYRKAI